MHRERRDGEAAGAGVRRGPARLELSAGGTVPEAVWERLERARLEAEAAHEAVPLAWPATGRRFLLRPSSFHGRRYWLTSPDCELGMDRHPRPMPAYVQLHSAYLHSLGPELAAGLLGTLLQGDVFGGPVDVVVSRVDVYADFEGCGSRGCRTWTGS